MRLTQDNFLNPTATETIVKVRTALHLTHSSIGCGAILRASNLCGLPMFLRDQQTHECSMYQPTSAIAKTTSNGSDFENSFQPGGGSV